MFHKEKKNLEILDLITNVKHFLNKKTSLYVHASLYAVAVTE